jgi:hypothetical protein
LMPARNDRGTREATQMTGASNTGCGRGGSVRSNHRAEFPPLALTLSFPTTALTLPGADW